MADQIAALTVVFTEVYYWIAVAVMFLLPIGFCLRASNATNGIIKAVVPIAPVTVALFIFGWYVYWAWPNGPFIAGGVVAAPHAVPWSELMGPHLGGAPMRELLDAGQTLAWARLNGVSWATFALFSWTVAAIVSAATGARIRLSALCILAVVVGAFAWVVGAAWGWHADGWMVRLLGYHDAFAAGVIHALAGGFALGALVRLGPRVGKRAAGAADSPMAVVGALVVAAGLLGLTLAATAPLVDVGAAAGMAEPFFSTANVYGAPTTISAVTVNFLMSLAGGLLAGHLVSRGDAVWSCAGGLAGIVGASAGNDVYHPLQALLVGAGGAWLAYRLHRLAARKLGIDDALGAVAVHGYAGVYGVLVAGVFLWGMPASMTHDARITPWGQAIGAAILFGGLGFAPAWLAAGALEWRRRLRIPEDGER